MNSFLGDPSLQPLWQRVVAALDRNGLEWRGKLTLPVLSPEGRRRLGIMIERPVLPSRRSVRLHDLALGVEQIAGAPLVEVLAALGHPPTGRHEAVQAQRAASRERWAALDSVVEELSPEAPWMLEWADTARHDGLFAARTAAEIDALVRRVRDIVAVGGTGRSRTEVAAQLLGDAHALDSATRLAKLTTRAFVERDGPGTERAVWERAGLPLDLVSAPILTWALPLIGDGAVAAGARAMTQAGLPLHLSTVALRAQLLEVPPGTPILVVENPRLVESAAERRLPAAVICTNGNPTTAPAEAIAALRRSGADLRYHGDFDTSGLAMAGRALDVGCRPFQMSAPDYLAALVTAGTEGVDLPTDPAPVPSTPWDAELMAAFCRHRLVVHEERVMDELLRAHTTRK